MDNELITEQTWWSKNKKWLITLFVFGALAISYFVLVLIDIREEPKNQIPFDSTKWSTKNNSVYPNRDKMLGNLISSDTLKKLKKEEIINLLGQPERIDSAYLFYRISQERIGFLPLHTKTLVIKLSNDSTNNKVMIHK